MKLSLLVVILFAIFLNSDAQQATLEDGNPDELEGDDVDQIISFNTETGEENSTAEISFAEESNLKDNETLGERNDTTVRHSLPKKEEAETKKPLILDPAECGDPPPVKNAIIRQGKEFRYEVGAKVTYACEFGYITDGSTPYSECRLSEDAKSLDWTDTEIRCSPKSCGDPGYVAHAHRVGSVFTFPNRVSFQCNDGYKLRGYGTRYCQTSGTWSGVLPTCEPIYCDPPANPENGKVSYSSLGFEAELHYKCDSGFILKNDQGRICSANGTWSGSEPVCQDTQCDPPVAPEYGTVQIIGDKSSVDSMAIYTCHEGRILVGSASSRCLDTGEWTFPTPKCSDPCSPPKIEHGKIGRYVDPYYRKKFQELPENSKIGDNEELYLRCEPNYEPFGKPVNETKVTCSQGEWEAVPVCEPAMCRSSPPPTLNAEVARANRTHGGYVVYHCRKYANKVKFGNVTCVFGIWKGVTPVCKNLRCHVKELAFPGLIKRSKTTYQNGEIFNVTCENGYNLAKENNKLKCVDGEWQGQLPPCVPASCNEEVLAEIEDIVPNHEKMVFNGMQLKVRCRDGYSPSGKQAHCSRGQWIVTGRLCQESSCTIHRIDNGGFSKKVQKREWSLFNGYTYYHVYYRLRLSETRNPGSSVYVSCDGGYIFEGKQESPVSVTCIKGKWYPDPVCLLPGTRYEKDEVTLETAEKLNIGTNTTIQPLVLTTQSRPSEPDATLNLNENLDPTPYPSCTCTYQNDDHDLIALVGSERLSYQSKVKNNDVIRFHCLQFGYSRLNGVPEIKCENCRSWHSSEFPQCTNPQTGDTILHFEGLFTILPGGIIGVQEGGHLTTRCLSSGIRKHPIWHATSGEQTRFTRYTTVNGLYISVLNISNVAASHHNKRYACYVPGYRPSVFDMQVITPPSVNCTKFEEKDYNIYYDKEQAVNSTAVFSCKDQHKYADGPHIVTCLSNGQWSGDPPQCKTLCPKIPETEGMSISYSKDLMEGSVAGFHCLVPRIRSGVPRTTCLPNGEWADPPAQCNLPSCFLNQLYDVVPEGVVPDSGDVASETLPYNFTLRLICENSMVISGSNLARCGLNGTWEVAKVQCVSGCGFPKTENSEMIIEPDKNFYRFGESVSLSCSPGYFLSSDVVRLMCLGTSWSETVMPECVKE